MTESIKFGSLNDLHTESMSGKKEQQKRLPKNVESDDKNNTLGIFGNFDEDVFASINETNQLNIIDEDGEPIRE